MTAARRNRNWSLRPSVAAFAAAALLTVLTSLVSAATTERVVVDPRTGLAIHGFDPVAYFTDAVPSAGREELEVAYAGAVWRFRNAGNRIAFAHDPGIYMPQFGGYDPIVLARGLATPGHPQLWYIDENRLYLFRSRGRPRRLCGRSAPDAGGGAGELAENHAQPRSLTLSSTALSRMTFLAVVIPL
jgi:hypothetical protein